MEQMTIEQVIAEQGINVLSLFDGISCGRVALDKAGIKVNKYYASEIDKYATQVSEKNWSDVERMGDITKWREWSIDWKSIDLILAGSPCQGFSFAGKQLAFDDPRSSLFFEFVNIYNHIKVLNPNVKFLLENVKMKQEFKDIISSLLGVQPIMINSALLSAQNRQRLYWANWEFGQPEDLGIVLSDVLQDDVEVDDKHFLTDKGLATMRRYLSDNYKPTGKSPTLTTELAHGIGKNIGPKCCEEIAATRGNTIRVGNAEQKIIKSCAQRGRYNTEGKTEQQIEVRQDEKANCLTLAQKDSMIVSKPVRIGQIGKGGQGQRIYSQEAKSVTLSALGGGQGAKTGLYDVNNYIRKLTPIECERLQTLPDDYTAGVSNTQRYKALGNGWTVDVIAHILKGI